MWRWNFREKKKRKARKCLTFARVSPNNRPELETNDIVNEFQVNDAATTFTHHHFSFSKDAFSFQFENLLHYFLSSVVKSSNVLCLNLINSFQKHFRGNKYGMPDHITLFKNYFLIDHYLEFIFKFLLYNIYLYIYFICLQPTYTYSHILCGQSELQSLWRPKVSSKVYFILVIKYMNCMY